MGTSSKSDGFGWRGRGKHPAVSSCKRGASYRRHVHSIFPTSIACNVVSTGALNFELCACRKDKGAETDC